MKYFLSIFFLFGWAWASSPEIARLEELIIQGKLSQAEILTNVLPLKSARGHYRGMIKFIRGNYKGSLEELSGRIFVREQYYSQICHLKLINLFKLKKEKQFHRESKFCLVDLAPYGSNGLVWPRSLHHITLGNRFKPFDLEGRGFEIWFKAGMYLQRDGLLEQTFLKLNKPDEEAPSLKELLLVHHYRQGRYEKAFVEAQKFSGTNAHNILGRIHWAGGNLKKSWVHFNRAVKYRKDSLNALEYLPSLAWILNHWTEGRTFLNRLAEIRELTLEESALLSAFYIQEGHYNAAHKGLNLLEKHFSKRLSLQGLLMGSYIALRRKDEQEFISYTLRACFLGEGLSCWLLLQYLGWNNFEDMIERKEMIFSEEIPDIEQYRQEMEITPLREKIFIRSKDIQELDYKEFMSEIDPNH